MSVESTSRTNAKHRVPWTGGSIFAGKEPSRAVPNSRKLATKIRFMASRKTSRTRGGKVRAQAEPKDQFLKSLINTYKLPSGTRLGDASNRVAHEHHAVHCRAGEALRERTPGGTGVGSRQMAREQPQHHGSATLQSRSIRAPRSSLPSWRSSMRTSAQPDRDGAYRQRPGFAYLEHYLPGETAQLNELHPPRVTSVRRVLHAGGQK